MEAIVRRILAGLGAPDLVDQLGERLPPSDLQSLLLAVMRRRAARATAPGLLALAERVRLFRPSPVDARRFHALDGAAFAAAAGFEAVALAPVAPLGLDAVLGRIDPNNVLTALRSAQVVGDPTSSLAIEAARRRRAARTAEPVRLCTSQQTVRLQPLKHPDHTPHFRLFALVTAGRAAASFGFERAALAEHLRVQLDLLRRLGELGYRFDDVEVTVSDTEVVRALRERGLPLPPAIADVEGELAALRDGPAATAVRRLARMATDVVAPLAAEWPAVRFRIDGGRLHAVEYYAGPCLHVTARDRDGAEMLLGDGGLVPWTAALLADDKERFFASGLGLELVAKKFGPA